MKGLFTGDWHYGLHVEELDRTSEIHNAVNTLCDNAIRDQVDFVSVGGDLLHSNNPSPDYIALLIQIFNRLDRAEIPTFILKGNHCAISATNKLWALTPLEEIGYKNIHFFTKPTIHRITSKLEGCPRISQTFLFLPHITRSQAQELGYKNPQEAIDQEAEKLLATLEENENCIVVSHYNVNGATAGTEKMMLRQSDLHLPNICLRSPKVQKIMNSHIHTAQSLNQKILMAGSIVCTDFGDLGSPKGYLQVEINGDEIIHSHITVKQEPLQFFEIDLVGVESNKIAKELSSIGPQVLSNAIVKIRLTIEEENLPYFDEDALKTSVAKNARFLKTLDKVVTKKRAIRDKEQKPTLSPKDAIVRYMSNIRTSDNERKFELAMKIISGESLIIQEDTNKYEHPAIVQDEFDKNLEKVEAMLEDTKIKPKSDIDFNFNVLDTEF